MDEAPKVPRSLSDTLDERLRAAAADPYAVLAELLGNERRVDHVEVLSLHGQELGAVRLLRILGTGGMGVTYEGVDADGARVAVKVLGRLDDAERVRFESECQILKTLDHPNVVRYRSHGLSPNGHAYLTMDLVEGTDLETLLSAIEGGADLDDVGEALLLGIDPSEPPHASLSYRRRVLRLLATIADALEHVHQQGVVHRDVKPANIIVQSDLTPMLIDFGLGRDLFHEVSWTRSGAVVGTVGWMAPEQLDGRLDAIGPRTDVFAVGLLLYRASTGNDLQRDLGDLVRLRRGFLHLTKGDRQNLDRGTLGVLYGCLEPEPRRRYVSAGDVAHDLRVLLRGERPQRKPPPPIAWLWRTRWGTAASVLLVLAVSWMAWSALAPQWSTVTIVGLEDDQLGVLSDAEGRLQKSLPLHDWVVPRGSVHELVYRSPRTPAVPIRFVADREVMRVSVLHAVGAMIDAVPAERRLYDGPDAALLDFSTFVPGGTLEVDGVEQALLEVSGMQSKMGSDNSDWVSAGWTRLLVRPGIRRVVFTEPDGVRWERDVRLDSARLEELVHGGRSLGRVAAAHKLTWSSALSDRPVGIRVQLTGPCGPYMDGPGQVRVEEGGLEQSFVYDFRNTGITPLVAGELCVVELEIQFPEPVRSGMAAFSASCLDRPGNEMVLEWSVEDGVWNRLPVFRYHKDVVVAPYSFRGIGPFGGSRYGVDFSELPAPGATVLRIRATMVADQEPGDAASIRFLGSYVNAPERADCALEVVGDPSPDPRELR